MKQSLSQYFLKPFIGAAVLIVYLITVYATSALAVSSASTVHTIDRLVLDATALTDPVKTRFEGKHTGSVANPYMIDVTVEKMSVTGSGGHIVFREVDPENFYQLDFRSDHMKILEKNAGVAVERARGGTGFGAILNFYHVRLVMEGNRFRVYEHPDLTNPVIDWTDPDNSFPVGRNVSYYATPGSLFCYEQVEARPTTVSLTLGHAVNLGGLPGYQSPQGGGGGGVVIGSSRYPFTFERYDAPSDDGSNPYDMIEGGFGGNSKWRLVWASHGAQLVYRANSPTAGGLPRSGYAVRVEADATRWGTLNSSGVFTPLATGRALAAGEDAYVVLGDSTHRVETITGEVIIPNQTDTTYTGLRSYIGHLPGTAGRLKGTFTPLL